jgi:hypothetical protein
MKDPHHMKLDCIIKFFKHVCEREASHGVPNAFRFKAVLSSRKKGTLQPPRYKDDNVESQVAEDLNRDPPRIRKRRKKARREEDPTLLNFEENTVADDMEEVPRAGRFSRRTQRQIPSSASSGDMDATSRNSNLAVPRSGQPPAATTTGLFTPQETPAPDEHTSNPTTKSRRSKASQRQGLITPSSTPNAAQGEPRRSQRKNIKVTTKEAKKIKRNSKKNRR